VSKALPAPVLLHLMIHAAHFFGRLALASCCLLIALSSAAQTAEVKAQMERAKLLRDAGSSEQAQKIYQAILPGLRGNGPSLGLSSVLNNLSDIANSAGDYDQALAFADESTQVCQKLSNINCEAEARNDAGYAFLNAGKYPQAAQQLELALALATQAKDAQTIVLVLNNLGNVQYYQAKYSDALRTYETALQYVEKTPGERWATSWRNVTQVNLATLYQRVGNDQRAIAMYLHILKSSSPLDSQLTARDFAHMHANLGVLYRRLGDADSALVNDRLAEKHYAKEKDTDGEIGVLKNIGILQALELGKLQDALKTFDRARSLAVKTGNRREAMQSTLYRAETLYRLGRLDEASHELDSALAAADALGTVEDQWKALYAMGRIAQRNGQADVAEQKFLEAIKRIESVRSKLQLAQRTDFLGDKRDVYDSLIKLQLDRNAPAAAFEYMERSRSRVFQDRFFSAVVSPAALNAASIQGRLAPGTALVEFWIAADAVAAVWLTPDASGFVRKKLSADDARQLEQLASNLPDNLGPEWQRDFKTISSLLPAGIAPMSDGRYPHLLIVPDGHLSLVPFDLMPTEQGSTVLESHNVTYLPSAVLLLRGALQKTKGLGWPWQRQLVAFGDPDVVGSGESSLVSDARSSSGRLPGSGVEIRSIAALVPGRAKLFLAQKDRVSSFFDSAGSRADLLHVSTHAIADMDNPERSRLLFSPDQPGQPNSYVFLKQLYDLDLRGVNLATLSACDTERGKLVPGEGVQAFSRALLAAGSRSSLTTLWRVPDGPTSEFMKQFYYFLLKQHKSKAEALRLTKLEFLHSGTELSHPKYWAAFVLNGDGTEPVPRFIPWQAIVLPMLVLLAAFLVLWQMRSRRKQS